MIASFLSWIFREPSTQRKLDFKATVYIDLIRMFSILLTVDKIKVPLQENNSKITFYLIYFKSQNSLVINSKTEIVIFNVE